MFRIDAMDNNENSSQQIRKRKGERKKARKMVWNEINVVVVNCCWTSRTKTHPRTNEGNEHSFSFFHSQSSFKIFVHSAFNCSVVVFFFVLWLRYFQWGFDMAHKFFRFDINLTSFYGCKTSSYCLLMSPMIFHSILAQSLYKSTMDTRKIHIFFPCASPSDEFIAFISFYSTAISLFLTH